MVEGIGQSQALIEKDLIAFDGTVFQVLSLPEPVQKLKPQQPHPLEQITHNMFKEVAP